MPVAYYVRTINVALLPVIWVTEKISRMLTRGNQEIGFNRHEFFGTCQSRESLGQMSEMETRIIKKLFGIGHD